MPADDSSPTRRPVLAAVALGSNLGDRQGHLAAAFQSLAALPESRLIARSSLHETEPVGPAGQGPYLNAAALLETELQPGDLLEALLAIERARGRERTSGERWGPRTLDLDLLLHGALTLEQPGLTLPHPRLRERRFVLAPLAEIAPNLPVPPDGLGVLDLLARLDRRDPTSPPFQERDVTAGRAAPPAAGSSHAPKPPADATLV